MTKRSEATAVGSSETFEEFYEREFQAVVGLAYALSGNRSGAEDLAQEAFLVAHRDWDRVGTYARPEVWVRRVVANFSVSVFRSSISPVRALRRTISGGRSRVRLSSGATEHAHHRSSVENDRSDTKEEHDEARH